MATKKQPPTPSYRWQRVHPALIVGHVLTVKSKREAPMACCYRQSDMDGACALHCLAMALVVLGLAKSGALTEMSRRKYGVPAEVFAEFCDVHFTGVDAPDFIERIHRLKLPINITARFKEDADLDRFTITNLAKGELLIVSFKSVLTRRTNHYALAVGCEGVQTGRDTHIDTLLLLDPSATEPEFRAWNSRLRMKEPRLNATAKHATAKPVTWFYESAEWAPEQVRLTAAIRFRLTEWV